LYRNERSRIRGFWFYNTSECLRIGELIGRLVKECEAKVSGQQNLNMMNPMLQKQPNANVDIFTLLSKAQEDFNNTGGGNGGPQMVPPLKFIDQNKQNHGNLNFNQPMQHHHQQQQPQQPDVTKNQQHASGEWRFYFNFTSFLKNTIFRC
jgi:hypothetical protein